ncbi:MAG: nucleotidyltransferase domain-containing protein [Moorellales bacterium]
MSGSMPLLEREAIIKAVREAVGRERLIAAAYLIGSYADGTATHLSDVDVYLASQPDWRPGV